MSVPERDAAATPLPVHPALRVVRLANGLRCWIWRHPRPEGTVCLALHLGTGSLNEADDERGLSHLLEHLAFHGSAHFPPGALQEFFASLGTHVGRHHNAFTAPDRTCYSLTLPENRRRTVETAVVCLADIAGGLSLLSTALEAERRVILEEMRARSGLVRRVRERLLRRLLPDARLLDRHPLGTEEVVRGVTPEQLDAFYRRWYRPELATVLAVGDLDPDLLEELVRAHFSGWRGSDPAPVASGAGVREPSGDVAEVMADPEVSDVQVRMLRVRPWQPATRHGELEADVRDQLTTWLANRRLGVLTHEQRVAFGDAALALAPLVRGWQLVRVAASDAGADPRPVADSLAREVRRLLVHGFGEEELQLGVRRLRSVLGQAARGEENAGAEQLLGRMRDAAAAGRPPMSREQARQLAEPALERTGVEQVQEALAAALGGPGRLVAAVVPPVEGGRLTPEELLGTVLDAEADAPDPPSRVLAASALLDRRPSPAPVVEERRLEALDTLSVTLGNGVRVQLRQLDYRRHRVFIQLNLAGGRLLEGADEAGLTGAAGAALSRPTTAQLSSVQIRDAVAGRGVALETRVEEDTVELRLSGDPAEIETGLELVHVVLAGARVEAPTLAAWQRDMAERWQARSRSLEVRLADEALRLLTGDDPRFRLLDPQQLQKVDLERVQGWLDRVVLPAPLEVAVVGDLPPERGLELVRRYLGSLPDRPLEDPHVDRRRIDRPPGPLRRDLTVEARPDRAAVLTGWQVAPWQETRQRLLLQMTEQILGDRLHAGLRQQHGLTYSAGCSYRPSKGVPQASLLSVAFYVAPERVEEALEQTLLVVHGLAERGPDEAEVAAVRRQFADLVVRVRRDPRYWCRVLSELWRRKVDPETLARLPEEVASLTADDMREVLERWIVDDGRVTVVCRPAAASPEC